MSATEIQLMHLYDRMRSRDFPDFPDYEQRRLLAEARRLERDLGKEVSESVFEEDVVE